MERQDIFEYAKRTYGTEPEYLWVKYPSYAVLRHRDNGKWYGIVMDVPRNRLGLPGTDPVDVLDVRCDPLLADLLRQSPGFLPGYHMNKKYWISILLDGTVSDEAILEILDVSYRGTGKAEKKSGCGT